MQLRNPPVRTVEALVESPGFTLVEEDDVAFALRLCREIHLIYGDYSGGRLPSTGSVLAGLMVTVEMLAALSQRVKDGMPGMRITVAAAQTREMLAVMFGQDPMRQPLDGGHRDRYRAIVAEGGKAVAALESGPLAAAAESVTANRQRRGWRRLLARRRS